MSSLHDDIDRVLFTQEQLAERVAELGRMITADYADRLDEPLLVMSILKGSVVFLTDLIRSIDLPLELDFVQLSSYGNATKSSGEVKVVQDINFEIRGRHVLIVEDLVDTGLTLATFSQHLESHLPASITIASLLKKQLDKQLPVDCRYVGFECPNEFIVGYGLDYAENYRNLPYIGVLKPQVYAT